MDTTGTHPSSLGTQNISDKFDKLLVNEILGITEEDWHLFKKLQSFTSIREVKANNLQDVILSLDEKQVLTYLQKNYPELLR